MSDREIKSDGNYKFNFSWILFLPIIALLGIVPLVTKLAIVNVEPSLQAILGTPQVFDFFSKYKSILIIMMATIILFILFLTFDKKKLKMDTTLKIYYIASGIFVLFTAISTFTSEYRQIALWGAPDRAEGLIVIGAYIVIMLYTIYVVNDEKDYRYIVLPLCFLVVVSAFLGVFQYMGKDLFLDTEFGKKIIVPEKYAELRESMTGLYEEGKIYGTLFHYNYMGSFGAMMVPLFATLTLFIKGYRKKILFGITTVLSVFLLLGSTSRAGLIGLGLSMVIFFIIFIKKIIKNYKITLPLLVATAVLVVGLNVAVGGTLFERIPTLVQDAFGLFLPAQNEGDYRDYIPFRDIICEGDTLTIELQGEKLIVQGLPEGLAITDSAGNGVEFVGEEGKYTTTDERYQSILLGVQVLEDRPDYRYLTIHHDGTLVQVARIDTTGQVELVNKYTLEPMTIDYPETIGFKGKEKLGSARGYIWARSLPMLKESLFIGQGPDTYVLNFPQNDIFAKWYAYDTPNMIVDKPHNLYLQIGIGQSVVALIAFLVIMIVYVVQSISLYAVKNDYTVDEIVGIAATLAVIGYLGAGIFNDSIVAVAPIFWILLGVGISMNYKVSKERKLTKKMVEHATIDMRTKKHIK